MLRVYTDGSHIPGQDGQGYAGIGLWFGPSDNRNESRYIDGNHITNQYTELVAIQTAIKYCRYIHDLEIMTDSQYSIDCITTWGDLWEKNDWKTTKKRPVLYPDVIQRIRHDISERQEHGMKTVLTHIKSHTGNTGNEGADKLARDASKRLESIYMSRVVYFYSGILSNFYHADIHTNYNGIEQVFICVEQYYQYHKAMAFNDTSSADNILVSDSPFDHKSIGQQVKGFDKMIWCSLREDVMLYGVRMKFMQNDILKKYLLSTADSIIAEASRDTDWGIGISQKDAINGTKWCGKNLLGRILMKVRHEMSQL